MKFPVEKYNIVVHQHPVYGGVEVIAWSTYAGKPVYGKAICREGDEYNEETGIKLAIARCSAKIARKRLKRASKMCDEANKNIKAAMEHAGNMEYYYKDALAEVRASEETVNEILGSL